MIFFKKKKTVPLKEHRRIVFALRNEIKRKDELIKELMQKNELVFKSSLKQAMRNKEILDIVDKLKEKVKLVKTV